MKKIEKLYLRLQQTEASYDPNKAEKVEILTKKIIKDFLCLTQENHGKELLIK